MTIAQALNVGEAALARAGVDAPRLDAELLLSHVLARKPLEIRLSPETTLSLDQRERYLALVRKRATRLPLAYVVGASEFMGLRLETTPDALTPRVDTETLVETTLAYVRRAPAPPTIVDVGAGTGAIALRLAQDLPAARVFATDLSPAALALARRNAARTGLADRIAFVRGDLLAPLREWGLEGQVHALVANLPYIPTAVIPTLMPEVSRFEPRLALDGGPDGLTLIRRLLEQAPRFLHPRGFVALEIGWDQAAAVAELLQTAEWVGGWEIVKDLSGNDRVAVASGREFGR